MTDQSQPPSGILLVEDNSLDARATFNAARKLAMADYIHVVGDGQAALDYLRNGDRQQPMPALVLLDLNLPGKDGHSVLAEMQADPELQTIPVVVLSTSSEEDDVTRAYQHGANAYITKPAELDGWTDVIAGINQFWFSIARLPSG
ncbi:MAG: response regulator [Acidimicrobiales bacterium]